MSGLPRILLKWLQSFDLTYPVNNPKWDLSNGFAVAEILSCYYPKDIKMSSFINRNSLQSKMLNWSIIKKVWNLNFHREFIKFLTFDRDRLLKKLFTTKKVNISFELIDGTIHCKDGAVNLFMEELYTFLTKKPLQKAELDYQIDFTDWAYQQKLPFHARSTASKTIKNNLKATEIDMCPNTFYAKLKAQSLLVAHFEHNIEDRQMNPSRFDRNRSVAEKCLRKPLLIERDDTRFTLTNFDDDFDYKTFKPIVKKKNNEDETPIITVGSSLPVKTQVENNYKEISVKQESYDSNMGIISC